MDTRTIIQQETVTREELDYVINQWVEENTDVDYNITTKRALLDTQTQAYIEAKKYFAKKYNIELYNINTVKVKAEYDDE